MYTIIGAGIGGLSTALAFEKKGINYQLFEKAPILNEVGAGIWLPPNALQVFESLNVLDTIKSAGNSIDRITIGKFDLSPLSDTFQNLVKDTFGYSTVAIHRAVLQKLLIDKLPKEKIQLGKGFKSSKTLKNNRIKITFDDDTTCETDFLIGADGIHSAVRKQLFPKSKIRYSGQTCWRGIADMQMDKEFENRGIELWGNQIRFGISKIAKNKVYWFAVALDQPNLKDKTHLIKEKLSHLFSSFHPLVLQLIAATSEENILRNDIIDLKRLDNWHKNNHCLIGDAAHATTPNMGQGGAQAIEDAYYLSSLIKNNTEENIFNQFQQKRRKKVDAIVKNSWTTGKMAHWKYGSGFRNFILSNIPKNTFEKKMLEMYKIEKNF